MYIGKKRVFYLTMGILCYMSNMAFAETVDTNVNKVDGEINTHVVTVTAKRLEATDLATPAIVDVYTQEDIQRTGAANAYDVLQNTLGVISQSQGFNGTSMGTMTSKIMIRGVEKGTLVLLDGVPLNQDGKYNLDDIPTDIIDSIEVVKGGGTVLYGSEATGGVINIRTKGHVNNQVSVGVGNFGKQRGSLTFGDDRFSIMMSAEHRGFAAEMAGNSYSTGRNKTHYDYDNGNKRSLLWKYKITDGVTFSQYYNTNKNRYLVYNDNNMYKGKLWKVNDYEDRDNLFTLNYDKDTWKGYISYGTQEKTSYQTGVSTRGVKAAKDLYSWRKGHNTNISLQKEFLTDKAVFLIGGDVLFEDMDLRGTATTGSSGMSQSTAVKTGSTQKRNTYSLFASVDYAASEKDNVIVSARQTWANNIKAEQTVNGVSTETKNDSMSKFTPEIQYIHQIDQNTSVYGKVGKSFRLPALTQIFGIGNIYPKLDLKPESGTHYEIGYKKITGKATYKVALFHYDIKDAIEAKVIETHGLIDVEYNNQDQRSTGIELSTVLQHNKEFSSNWGIMFQNPKTRSGKIYGDSDWHSIYNKYQITSGLHYQKDKWSADLMTNFVGNRTSADKYQRHIKPQFFTDLHVAYEPNANQRISLHINNLFDRKDILTNSTSNFYSLGRNYMVDYSYKF